jgi:anaerobic selenocysteine-containing dehydrogenase/Ni/Fe-hydrogenase subunit HybB-like protein
MDHTLVNEHIRWGLIVVTYMFLSGLGAGSLIVAVLPQLPWVFGRPALLHLRRAAIISAAACFVVVPLAVIADLGQPWRMWRVILAPHLTSAMPYGSYTLLLLTALIFVNLWLIHRPHLAKAGQMRQDFLGRVYRWLAFDGAAAAGAADGGVGRLQQAVAMASVVAAMAFVAYTGFLLSTMASFGLWYTPLLGVVFAVAALASGFAWLLIVSGLSSRLAREPELLRLLAGSAAAFLLAYVGIRLWDLAHAAYVENLIWPAVQELLFRRLFVSYVGVELLVGGALAILVLVWTAWQGYRIGAVVGGVLALIGLFAGRWNIIIGGQSISRTGAGFIIEDWHIWGREGVVAAAGLCLWALVVGYALWRWLPWYGDDRPRVGSAQESATPPTSAPIPGRRQALTLMAGVALAVAAGYDTLRALFVPHYRKQAVGPTPPTADRVVHSICLACDARCGNRAVVRDGVVRTLYGNPYHPASTMNQPIPFNTPVEAALRSSGTLCLKGVSGLQYLYDPYRIRLPLKRTGPRGSGQFKAIAWEQLIQEIVDGGPLFADIGETRHVEGLRAMRSFDPIDPTQPELGPKAYQLVWNTGRGQTGREDFIQRFMNAYGSKNYVSHTDLCQMNWYVANYLFTGRYNPGVSGATNQLFGDIVNSQYMLFFGVNLGGGWKPGVNTSAPILANRHARGDGKLVLIDPYVPHGRHYADEWVPIKPGTDAALALGMMRWIIEHERYNKAYLENPSPAAAEADGETTWVNGTYLVIWQEDDDRHRRFLRARDLNLGTDEFVVLEAETGAPATHLAAKAGSLFIDTTVTDAAGRSLRVKSALQLLREEAFSRTTAEWGAICDIPVETIEHLAAEFTSHGRQATASCYRGAVMHSYGIYAGLAINMLNALIGNFNWKGGVVRHASGPAWDNGLFDLRKVNGAPAVKGVHISRIAARSDVRYEQTTEYRRKTEAGQNPYPPQRPWYPFSHAGITTEALAAADTGYPYPVKCYINYYINAVKSIPGGERYIDTFTNPDKIPLFISVDTTISETSMYADYIVPDAMFLDGHYGFMAQQVGACTAPHMAIRTPAIEPLTGRTADGRPMILETFLIDMAQRLGLPGHGEDAIPGVGPHAGRMFPLHRAEDYYLRGIANIAFNGKVAPAPPAEVTWVEHNYPVAAYRQILTDDEWQRAALLLARGGYFEPPDSAWDEQGRHRRGIRLDPKAPFQIWHEGLAKTHEPMTGRLFPGTATYRPAEDGSGRRLEDIDAAYPFQVVTFRLPTRTKARTAYDYWALEIHPLNFIEVNRHDAARLGIRDGDRVRLVSASGSAEGVVKLSDRVRPGVIAGTHHFGHSQQGNSPWQIDNAVEAVRGGRDVSPVLHGLWQPIADGNHVRPDPRRGSRGFNVNSAMRRNDALAGTPLVDNAGGATIFLDSRVRLEKVQGG